MLKKELPDFPLHQFNDALGQKALTEASSKKLPFRVKGLVGSGQTLALAASFKHQPRSLVWVLEQAEQAAYYLNDLEELLGNTDVLFFPASYRQAYVSEATDNANVLLRAEVLRKLTNSKRARIIVTYPQAIFEKVISQHTLKKNTLKVQKGTALNLDFINETLFEYGFERADFVTEPGTFSVRGGIIDVFSYANQHPYRIEFFGDEVESLRSFDVRTQLSIQHYDQIELLPNTSSINFTDKRKTLLDLLPEDHSVIFQNLDACCDRLDSLFEKATQQYDKLETTTQFPPETLFCSAQEWHSTLPNRSVLLFDNAEQLPTQVQLTFQQQPQPAFNKKFDVLVTHLNANHQKGWTNYLCCTNEQQVKRFHDIFQEMEETVHYQTLVCPLFEGFEDPEAQVAVFTDHQIFDRYHKYRVKSQGTKSDALTLQELTLMEIGDYVTHMDHGIGKFGGLQHIDVEGKKQEAIKLVYGEGDVLYLSIHALHKISKFNGKDGKIPKLYKLGSKAWKTLKQKTKKRVKEIAFNLIQLYAERRKKIGYAYAPDSYLQWELEASFLYEDTPDQEKATADIKADMESERPMDRLVCGDVGFGKTEVAVRAAFKAVDNSKQVAVLVPTTILAFQHFKTFSNRLKNLPVRVDYLNRFRTAKDRKAILEDLKFGKIDILIGTHQIAGKAIEYADLGLLIVDEEQKFGVAVKEKIRSLKKNIDVLTLTATPIPRTLQFSLMAARDLSVIATPPPNRYPIQSEVVRFNEHTIRDGIIYELQRGGQVYFVHNRVDSIQEVADMIQRLVPDARIGIGHGQMDGDKLEKTLLKFLAGQYDILVATTIIENGLDVPNANTIFINNANNFGLSDLHQMRGRVGRSNKKAFCYFMTPPLSAMTSDAQKRIQTITQYAELGSGIQIAKKDLEIRGAGDLLGGEQSGFINDIGFDAYQKILEEALTELKDNEFKTLFEQERNTQDRFVADVQLDTDMEIMLPDHYVNSVKERLTLYNQLSQLKKEEELTTFEKNLEDRFGPLPDPTTALLNSVRVKWAAAQLGLERLVIKNNKCVGYFIAQEKHPFYESLRFQHTLNQMQAPGQVLQIKQKETRQGMRLILIIPSVETTTTLLDQLTELINPTATSDS
ncbi:MAG: transcription-repair coupling factor [Flavobacteriaceae bacterium]